MSALAAARSFVGVDGDLGRTYIPTDGQLDELAGFLEAWTARVEADLARRLAAVSGGDE